jgi:hypothetical protein
MDQKPVLKNLGPCLLVLAVLATTITTGAARAAVPGAQTGQPASPMVPAYPPGNDPGEDTAAPFTLVSFDWVKTWGDSAGEVVGAGVALDSSGSLYIAGQFIGTVDFDPARSSPTSTFSSHNGTVDAFLSKLDANGNYLWTKVWGDGYTNAACPSVNMGCGRDAANAVAVDGSGNVYVAGLFQDTLDLGSGFTATSNAPNGSNNIFLASFTPAGAPRWLRAWGGKTGGEAYSLALDAPRGYLYVEGDWSTSPDRGTVDFNPGSPDGLRQNHGFYDAFLAKYDLNGGFQWVRTWGGSQYDDGPGVAVDDAGSLYVAGMYGSQDINFDPAGSAAGLGHPASDDSSMLMDVFLVKFDGSGAFQWVRTWGGPGTEESGACVSTDHAGGVYATGRFSCSGCNFNVGAGGPVPPADLHTTQGDFDAFLSKFDSNGTFQWASTWGGAQIDIAGVMAVDTANIVSVSALVDGTRGGTLGRIITSDASISRFTPAGALQWRRTWGGSGADNANGLFASGTDALYAAGNFQSTVDFNPDGGVDSHTAAGTGDAFLSKFTLIPLELEKSLFLPFIK